MIGDDKKHGMCRLDVSVIFIDKVTNVLSDSTIV